MFAAAMTSKTTDRRVSFEVRLIESLHHLDHFARGALFRFLVRNEVPLVIFVHMAKSALNSQRRTHVVHDGNQLGHGQAVEHLNIFLDLFHRLFGWRGRSAVGLLCALRHKAGFGRRQRD